MLDVDAFLMSLKAAWVSKLLNCNGKWSSLFQMINNRLKFPPNYIWKTTARQLKQFPILKCFPEFYQEVIFAFNHAKYIKPLEYVSKYDICNEPLWGNSHFKCASKCLYFKSWLNEGILYVKDILDDNGNIMSDGDFFRKIRNKANIYAEIMTIKKHVFKLVRHTDLSIARYTKTSNIPNLIFENKQVYISHQKSKFFYKILSIKNGARPNMESIHSRKWRIPNHLWDNIYEQKIQALKVPILRSLTSNFLIISYHQDIQSVNGNIMLAKTVTIVVTEKQLSICCSPVLE